MRGQQLNLVKALRQEYSGGHRDSSGHMVSSSSVSYDRTILNDCRDGVGGTATCKPTMSRGDLFRRLTSYELSNSKNNFVGVDFVDFLTPRLFHLSKQIPTGPFLHTHPPLTNITSMGSPTLSRQCTHIQSISRQAFRENAWDKG